VQGTYSDGNGTYTATGRGQTLVGDAGSPVEGLMVLYNGTANSATAHVDYTKGIAGIMNDVTSGISAADGIVASQTTALSTQVDQLTSRQADVQARLDAKRAALTAQYTAMETALSTIQSQATYLTQQINSINGLQSTK
jgi:flagellar hook-associated protein 2